MKTNISYNPSLAAELASNLLFIYSAQGITLAPETPGISAEQARLWEAHNGRAAGPGLPAVFCRKGCDFPSWFLCICRGITAYSHKTKEGIQCIWSHLFLPCFSIFSNYHETPCWRDDFSPSLPYQKCISRIIPSKLVKSMTRLSLDENVTQTLITFHTGLPEAPTAWWKCFWLSSTQGWDLVALRTDP